MSAYVFTPLAKDGISNIWSYIAEDNEAAADRVERAIYDACAAIGDNPMRGHSRPDLTGLPLRFWTLTRYPNYTLVYRQRRLRFRSLPCSMGSAISADG